MFTSVRCAVFALVLGVAASASPSAAQEAGTFVVVPDAPGGAVFTGCYRADPRLWDRHRLHFCLTQRGTYSVNGGGVSCDGRLSWRTRNNEILVSIQRTPCGNGVAWAAAEMTCRGGSLLGNIIGQILAPNVMPRLRTLRCTYFPSVAGYSDQQITARRTD